MQNDWKIQNLCQNDELFVGKMQTKKKKKKKKRWKNIKKKKNTVKTYENANENEKHWTIMNFKNNQIK